MLLAPNHPPPLVPQVLDGDHAGGGPAGHLYRIALHRHDRVFTRKTGRRAAERQDAGDHEADGEQQARGGFQQVVPEVAQLRGGFMAQCLEQRDQRRDPRGRAHELQERDHEQLGKISEARFAGVVLQVTVHEKADGRVESKVRRLAPVPVRVQRQLVLENEQEESVHEPDHVDGQQRFEVLLPVHFLFRIDAAEAVDKALHRAQEVEPRFLALKHAGNVFTQRNGDEQCEQIGGNNAG